ncbi:adenylyltransferase, partial [Candidatus Bathyarchaeota archaeon]
MIEKEKLTQLELGEKIKLSKKIIEEALEKFKKSIITWTGGKDSTLMLWLIRNVCLEKGYKMPEVIFINEGDVFEEIVEFIDDVGKKWNLKVVEVKNEDVLRQVKKVGDVIKVSKLNQRNQAELKRIGFEGKEFVFEPESLIGCHLMKTVPLNEYVEKNKIDAVFVAIRWDE